MNTTARARAQRAPLRSALFLTAALSGVGLLLAACSSAAPAAGLASGASAPHRAAGKVALAAPYGTSVRVPAGVPSTAARLLPPQSIIFTASLTVQAKDVAAASAKATSLVNAAGGYISNQQETTTPGNQGSAEVSLELKIPVARYNAVLIQLETALGKQLNVNSQAQDVTQQVADVGSRVTSAQAAIRQLRALLGRAGSVSALLSVQDEINAQESSLEALLAQQRALAHETSYGTVSLLLVGRHVRIVKHHKKSGGFGGGLRAGWHALGLVVTAVLTALGAALPFIVLAALLGGIAYAGRRRLTRRRTPATDPATPAP